MEFFGKLSDSFYIRLAVDFGQIIIKFFPRIYSCLPRERHIRHLAHIAELFVFALEVINDIVESSDSHFPALCQYLSRIPAVGKEIVIAESSQRCLHCVRAFCISLLQGNRRNRNLALGNVTELSVKRHLPGNLRDQQVRIQSAESLTDVSLFSESHKARQKFSYAAVIYIAVFVSRAVVG